MLRRCWRLGASGAELIQAAKQAVGTANVPVGAVSVMQKVGSVVVDIRNKTDFEAGTLPDAIHCSRSFLEFQFPKLPEVQQNGLDGHYLLLCKSGGRATLATQTLQDLGYTNVKWIDGGYMAWEKENANK
eukprot:TRINITY_DN105133_c0_g1_i1.p1 TRINITY_DN105133_c0_g1~~TRINITY_DN105133_c0_g1_i1.p1  ORF type:complete len:130 (+),score=6.64 TRINITY_DN105133_c0_g1_i1:33-422(+)